MGIAPHARRLGPGLWAGAVLLLRSARFSASPLLALLPLLFLAALPLGAQVSPPARRDTTRRPPADTTRRPPADTTRRPKTDTTRVSVPIPVDTTKRGDSLRIVPSPLDSARGPAVPMPVKARPDSVKTPLAHAEIPPPAEVGEPYRWDRNAIFASGAVSVLDLLERIPGVTTFRAGWVTGAQTAAYLGEFRRIRFFLDGIELDAVDPHNNGIHDLNDIPLWTLGELQVERAGGELRVHMRTWSVRATTPYTRVDVATGDENTNAYRGFFGRRFQNGIALQAGGQTFASQPSARIGGGGDLLSLMTRIGWARGPWSVDGWAGRLHRRRDPTRPLFEGGDSLPTYDGTRQDAYLRAAYGDPDSGPWIQALAHALHYSLGKTPATLTPTTIPPLTDTSKIPDTVFFRAQYVLAAGITRWGVRFSATDRFRVFNHQTFNSPSLRAAYARGPLTISAFGERSALDSLSRVDATAQLSPLPFISIVASAGHIRPDSGASSTNSTTARAEVGLRLGRMWISGGAIMRDSALLIPPTEFGVLDIAPTAVRATGETFAVRGPLLGALSIDMNGIVWNRGDFYRPKYQTHTQLSFATNWLSRFPSGQFGLRAAVIHDYRAATAFPTTSPTPLSVDAASVLSTLLEIRIQNAVASWQFRNATGTTYQQVPGFRALGPVQYYGVRWEFSN